MKIVKVRHQTGESLPILLDEDGLPLTAPNEFVFFRRLKSYNTILRNLRELSVFYQWLASKEIDLNDRISSAKLLTEAETTTSLGGFLRKNFENKTRVVSPKVFNLRLVTIRIYLLWRIDIQMSSMSFTEAQFEIITAARERLIARLDRLFINMPPNTGSISRKALTFDEAEFLLNCLNPHNLDSFGLSEPIKYRNFTAAYLMLTCGLRPGELLSLRLEDLKIRGIPSLSVVRRELDPYDLRKTTPSIKRNGRIIGLENNQHLRIVDQYCTQFRENLLDKSDRESDYLILSDEGKPLSHSSLTQLFILLRHAYPGSLPTILSPKALRHTFSIQLEKILRDGGMKEQHRAQALAFARGDSSLESQQVYIAEEIQIQVRKASASYQRKLLGE